MTRFTGGLRPASSGALGEADCLTVNWRKILSGNSAKNPLDDQIIGERIAMHGDKNHVPETIERWILFEYVGRKLIPLSKPFKKKEQAENTRLKFA